jgi:hypothetical protein
MPYLQHAVRSDRPSVTQWFDAFARQHGRFDVTLADLADFELPVYDEPEHPSLQHYHHEHTKNGRPASASPMLVYSVPRNIISDLLPLS